VFWYVLCMGGKYKGKVFWYILRMGGEYKGNVFWYVLVWGDSISESKFQSENQKEEDDEGV